MHFYKEHNLFILAWEGDKFSWKDLNFPRLTLAQIEMVEKENTKLK